MKKQSEFKKELLDILNSAGAKIVGEDDVKWLIHFEVNGVPFIVLYDDGISCFRYGKFFYSPLEWGEPYFSIFREMLVATKN